MEAQSASGSKMSATPRERVTETRTQGESGGVGEPFVFGPLQDEFQKVKQFFRSDDVPFMSVADLDVLLNSISEWLDLDKEAGWWTLDQSSGAWFGTGLRSYYRQFSIPPRDHGPITRTHHHGGAVWVAPVDRSGIELVVVAGDAPRRMTTDGPVNKTECVRRPVVSCLCSGDANQFTQEANANLPVEFSGGHATSGSWSYESGGFSRTLRDEDSPVVAQYLETVAGPRGPEIEITNPYFQAPKAVEEDCAAYGELPDRNRIYRLAAHERLRAHPAMTEGPSASRDLSALTPGDALQLKTMILTNFSSCCETYLPANAEVRVSTL